MSKLMEFYKALLKFCDIQVDERGKLYDNSTGKKIFILLDEKEIILPTNDNLRLPNVTDYAFFHPIPEYLARGESPIVSKMAHILNIKLNLKSIMIFKMLLHILFDESEYARLTPVQSEMLSQFKTVDKTGYMSLNKILDKGVSQGAAKFILNIFLRRGVTLNEQRYSRGGIVTFPLYEMIPSEEMFNKNSSVMDIKIREKDRDVLLKLNQLLFPNCHVKHAYSKGSNSDYLPYLEALYTTASGLADRILDVISVFPDQCKENEITEFDTSFMDYLGDMDSLINEARRIPAQPGNIADHPAPQAAIPAQAAMQQPQMQPQMYPQPGPYAPVPGYGQQPYAPPPPIVNPDNSVSMASIMANNPQLQAQLYPYGNPLMQAVPQRQASWASQAYGIPMNNMQYRPY